MTKRCERCGKDVDDAPFCPNCWTRLELVAERTGIGILQSGLGSQRRQLISQLIQWKAAL